MAALANIWKEIDHSEDVMETGDFRIDVHSRSAAVRGLQLHLTGAEFDVLVFLTSHKRRLVTPHTRLTTQSEEGGLRQAKLLPALLSLRKKLQEEVPGARYIDTEAWLLVDFHPGTGGR
jgi:DNA-binding response OmpR family regulator